MSIDKFGRSGEWRERKILRGAPGEGFNLTGQGDYDLKNKRIINIAQPIENFDVVSKQYVDSETQKVKRECVKYNINNLTEINIQIKILKDEIEKLEHFCRSVDKFVHDHCLIK